MVRRVLPLLALTLFIVAPAEAQKRRAVRSGPPVVTPPAGSCHTFGLVRPGLKATYHATGSGEADFTITYVSDAPTLTVTTQKVTTAQGVTDVQTRLDGEIVGNLRGLKHINVKGSTVVPVLGTITTETDIDFVPSLVMGPAAGWCVGNTWTTPAVTETIVNKTPAGQNQQIVTTIASTGEVLAVNDIVTVPGGQFNTVKYRGAAVSGTSVQSTITWVSMQHNIVVKQETLDAAGNVTSTLHLTAVQ